MEHLHSLTSAYTALTKSPDIASAEKKRNDIKAILQNEAAYDVFLQAKDNPSQYKASVALFKFFVSANFLEIQHYFFLFCKLILGRLHIDMEIENLKITNQNYSTLLELSEQNHKLVQNTLKSILQNDRILYYQIFVEFFKSLRNLVSIWHFFVNNNVTETVFLRHFSDIPIERNYFISCNIPLNSFSSVIRTQMYFLEICNEMVTNSEDVLSELQTTQFTTLAQYLQIGNLAMKMTTLRFVNTVLPSRLLLGSSDLLLKTIFALLNCTLESGLPKYRTEEFDSTIAETLVLIGPYQNLSADVQLVKQDFIQHHLLPNFTSSKSIGFKESLLLFAQQLNPDAKRLLLKKFPQMTDFQSEQERKKLLPLLLNIVDEILSNMLHVKKRDNSQIEDEDVVNESDSETEEVEASPHKIVKKENDTKAEKFVPNSILPRDDFFNIRISEFISEFFKAIRTRLENFQFIDSKIQYPALALILTAIKYCNKSKAASLAESLVSDYISKLDSSSSDNIEKFLDIIQRYLKTFSHHKTMVLDKCISICEAFSTEKYPLEVTTIAFECLGLFPISFHVQKRISIVSEVLRGSAIIEMKKKCISILPKLGQEQLLLSLVTKTEYKQEVVHTILSFLATAKSSFLENIIRFFGNDSQPCLESVSLLKEILIRLNKFESQNTFRVDIVNWIRQLLRSENDKIRADTCTKIAPILAEDACKRLEILLCTSHPDSQFEEICKTFFDKVVSETQVLFLFRFSCACHEKMLILVLKWFFAAFLQNQSPILFEAVLSNPKFRTLQQVLKRDSFFREKWFQILSDTNFKLLITRVVAVFYINVSLEIDYFMPYVLPRLIVHKNQDAIAGICEFISKDVTSLFNDFKYDIYAYLFVREQVNLQTHYKFIKDCFKQSKLDLNETYPFIFQKLISQYGINEISKSELDAALTIISQISGKEEKHVFGEHVHGINEYLRTLFLKYGDLFSEVESIVCSIRVYTEFINRMEKQTQQEACYSYINIFRDKLHLPEVQKAFLESYKTIFASILTKRESSNKVAELELFFDLLPLLDTPIKESAWQLVQKVKQSYPTKIADLVLQVIPSLRSNYSDSSLRIVEWNNDTLNLFIANLMHRRDEVRYYCTLALSHWLQQHRLKVVTLCQEGAEEMIMLLRKLLFCVKLERVDRILVELANCLGELGALDSSKIVVDVSGSEEWEEMTNDNIGFLSKIFRDFIIKDLYNSDEQCFMLAQYLSQTLTTGSDIKITELKLSERDAQKIQDYKGENFFMSKIEHQKSEQWKAPFFEKSKDNVVWINQVSKYLIDRVAKDDASLENNTKFKIMTRCKYYILLNAHFAEFLFPYIIQHLVLFSSKNEEVCKFLKEELHGILFQLENRPNWIDFIRPVFQLFEILSKWYQSRSFKLILSKGRPGQNKSDPDYVELQKLDQLLQVFPLQRMAELAYHFGMPERATKFVETHIRQSCKLSDKFKLKFDISSDTLSLFHRIYSTLEEPDGMSAFSALQSTTSSLGDQIINHEALGNWAEALNCHELLLTDGNNSPVALLETQLNILNCLKNLGNLRIMKTNIEGLMQQQQLQQLDSNTLRQMKDYVAQCSWRLGDWSLLKKFPDTSGAVESSQFFETSIAELLQCYEESKGDELLAKIKSTKSLLIPYLKAAAEESYRRVYPILLKLQMLTELESSYQMLNSRNTQADGVKFLKKNLLKTQYSISTREPLISLRRQLFRIHHMNHELSLSWISWAQLARESNQLQTASSALLQVTNYELPLQYFIERAKLMWQQGSTALALDFVQNTSDNLKIAADDLIEVRRQKAKIMLLAANWNAEQAQKHQATLENDFAAIKKEIPNVEESHFYYAKFMDQKQRLEIELLEENLNNVKKEGSSVSDSKLEAKFLSDLDKVAVQTIKVAISSYVDSLQLGNKHIYHSMPRLLTLWLDSTQRLSAASNSNGILQLNETIQKALNTLGRYQWTVAVNQLISRMVHPQIQTRKLLLDILIAILSAFPQQIIYYIVGALNTVKKERKECANEVIKAVITRKEESKIIIEQSKEIIYFLDKIKGEKDKKESNPAKLTKYPEYKTIKQLLERNQNQLKVIVPTWKNLSVDVPHHLEHTSVKDANLFDEEPEYITGFGENADIMNSAIAPKKLTIYSHEKVIRFLVKREDVRKDARYMEFASIVNRLLRTNQESKSKALRLRLYGVITIADECGVIEWVDNTTVFRNLVFPNDKEETARIKISNDECKKNPKLLYEWFVKLCDESSNYRLLMHKWFLSQFSESSRWFEARNLYTRSMAVAHMIGFIVGLGDRHTENLLLDVANGEAIQIDFGHYFDRGRSLATPELVPFRLTRNIIDGFGVTGVEGIYRNVAETTIKILRDNRETLLSTLETFIYDPLLEWKEDKKRGNKGEQFIASETLRQVDRKLQGYVLKPEPSVVFETSPLNVKGQVDQLIRQATNPELLSRMYIWWMPWI